jgi:hypothetical protein
MSAVQQLADRWADHLADRLSNSHRVHTPFHSPNDGTAVGSLTVTTGTIADHPVRVVDTRLIVAATGINAVMLHAFAPAASTSPHLLSDNATARDTRGDGEVRTTWHFHVDLMPRMDPVLSPHYMTAVHEPLTACYRTAHAVPDSTPIAIPHRLRALASPWIIGTIVEPHDADALDSAWTAYADRWCALVAEPPLSGDPTSLIARDTAHRAAMFDTDTDPVWDHLAVMIGHSATNDVLTAIREPVLSPPTKNG